MKFIYQTDESGSFIELINWEEIRDCVNKVINKLSNYKLFKNIKEKTKVINQIKAIFQSKEMIEQVVIKEIQLYHAPYGLEYSLDEKLEIEAQLPNPFGGEPFPTIIFMELTDLQPELNYCNLVIGQKINSRKAENILLDLMKKLIPDTKKLLKKDEMFKIFNISDHTEYKVELDSGWINDLLFKRTMIVNNIKQIDSYKMTIYNKLKLNYNIYIIIILIIVLLIIVGWVLYSKYMKY